MSWYYTKIQEMENKNDRGERWLNDIVDSLAEPGNGDAAGEKQQEGSAENRRFNEQMKDLFDSVGIVRAGARFNTNRAYELFSGRVNEARHEHTSQNTARGHGNGRLRRRAIVRTASIAASLAFLAGFAIPLAVNGLKIKADTAPGEVVVESPPGQKSKLYLPDKTLVWLNSGSKLTYYTDFNSGNRTVLLEGEAFFDVSHNKQLPFDVMAGELKIEVLGTSFNVNAYEGERNTVVSLLNGKVMVRNAADDALISEILPQHKIVIDKTDDSFRLLECDADMEGIWRHGQLRINNDHLLQLISKMERWYGVNIHLAGEPVDEYYWMTIKTESLTEILELINRITPIHYKIEGEEVTVRCK